MCVVVQLPSLTLVLPDDHELPLTNEQWMLQESDNECEHGIMVLKDRQPSPERFMLGDTFMRYVLCA